MRIYITKADIRNGRPCSACKCPLARSLQRRFPRRFVTVGPRGGMVGHKILLWTKGVRNFISRFDGLKSVKPFSFNLDL
jgi:hypothetical protein